MTDQPQVRLVGLSEDQVEELRLMDRDARLWPDAYCVIRSLADSYDAGITVEEAEEVVRNRGNLAARRGRDKLRRFTQQGEPDA